MLYINVGADALIGPMAGLFGEQALQYGLTEYLRTTCKQSSIFSGLCHAPLFTHPQYAQEIVHRSHFSVPFEREKWDCNGVVSYGREEIPKNKQRDWPYRWMGTNKGVSV